MRGKFEILFVALAICGQAWAGPFEDGLAAHARGDYATALRLLRPLADKGNASAKFYRGLMYDYGQGVPQDDAQALKWYRFAADQDYAAAQYNLGVMFANGQGVRLDYSEAVKWFQLAADQGHMEAQYNLGQVYENGLGVLQDYARAAKWYRLASDQGYALAQNNLGVMYDLGRGVPQDYVQAHKWFNLAASQYPASEKEDREKAVKNRDRVAAKMTSAQLAEAQALTRQCQLQNFKRCDEQNSANGRLASLQPSPSVSTTRKIIPLENDGGTFVVPIVINGVITLKFIVDSGAADVSIPADVVSTLIRTGTIAATDFLGKQTYVLADGSRIPSQTFRIRSLKVGDVLMENVTGGVAPADGSLLLGQSFLGRLKSWSMDNQMHALVIE